MYYLEAMNKCKPYLLKRRIVLLDVFDIIKTYFLILVNKCVYFKVRYNHQGGENYRNITGDLGHVMMSFHMSSLHLMLGKLAK